MHVLVVEDDARIAALVERALKEGGHVVELAATGQLGADRLLSGQFDVALLDVLLPDMDGFEVLGRVRARSCKTPVLMLTAVDAVPKILKAFDLGADDYIVKPFILEILLARVAAIGRRVTAPSTTPMLEAGDLVLDRNRRVVIRNGREIALTRKQFQLLDALMSRRGLITTREQLIEAGWGYVADVRENTLEVYIHGLRAKLEDHADNGQDLIRTVHGTGYMFVAA